MVDIPKDILLKVDGLKKHFPISKGFFRRTVGYVKAVDDISFSIPQGETLGLVGESGSGKTTTGRLILRAMDPTDGTILFSRNGQVLDIAKLSHKEMKDVRSDIQMIFQDPNSSLNPRMPVLEIVAEPLRSHGWKKQDYVERVRSLLDMVGLDPRFMKRFPHAFSGGQRQRIGIARALALSPSLIVADEPVSALDVSVQAQILNLMKEIQDDLNLTYLFIAHDLSVIRYICDWVAVMYAGTLVEVAQGQELFSGAKHPYTKTLISAAPPPDPHENWLGAYESEQEAEEQDTEAMPENGCPFAPRCDSVMNICWKEIPELKNVNVDGNEHNVCCHLFR